MAEKQAAVLEGLLKDAMVSDDQPTILYLRIDGGKDVLLVSRKIESQMVLEV